MIKRKDDIILLNVLAESTFEDAHIPGSHNVPHEHPDFTDQVSAIVRNRAQPVVVYCAIRDSQASYEAVTKLERAGFANVFDYEDGMAGWRYAGYDVESAATVG